MDHKFEVMDSLLDIWPTRNGLHELTRPRFRKEDVSSHFTRRSVTSEEMHFPDEYSSLCEGFEEIPLVQDITSTISTHRLVPPPPAFFKAMGIKEKRVGIRSSRVPVIIGRKSSERWLVFTEFKETARYLADSIEGRLVLTMSGESSQRRPMHSLQRDRGQCHGHDSVGSEGLDFQFCSTYKLRPSLESYED